GGRQDPCPVHWTLLTGHAATVERESPVRRPTVGRDGSLGTPSLWRRLDPARVPDRQVRRCPRAFPNVRGDREGRTVPRARTPGILQRPGQGTPEPGAGCGADQGEGLKEVEAWKESPQSLRSRAR